MPESGCSVTDAEAFFRSLHPRLVRTLALHCGDTALAEEVAQESLARAWERWDRMAEMASADAWVFRVAFNLLASRFRRRSAERRARARLRTMAAEAHGPHHLESTAHIEDALTVRSAVSALPARQRAAIILRYFADLDVARTAEVLECRPGTVKSLTSQAVANLRRWLVFDIDPPLEEAIADA